MSLFGTATRAEQARYYRREWSEDQLPDFIVQGLESREFAFDHDGNGPSDRYNVMRSVDELADYLRRRAPFSAYCSVAFYSTPERRDGIYRTELAFDIDAKDLPVRSCSCPPGEVCETCLADAKALALDYIETLKDDLDLRDLHLVYSGRGYHIRVMDEEVSMVSPSARRRILDYVSGAAVPKDLFMEFGYSAVFRKRVMWILQRLKPENLSSLPRSVSRRVLENKEAIRGALVDRDRVSLNQILGEKRLSMFLSLVGTLATGLTDGKVTMDEKRIIRLPSSLHSKVSMKCMPVQDPDRFDPLRDAVPEFVKERGAAGHG